MSRTEMVASPRIVETRQASQGTRTRSWEREVLIIGGGAAAGGVGGLIYDLVTRNKK